MAFPIVQHPTFILTLPSNKQTINYRPFLEVERKILLMALETNNDNEIQKAVLEIIKSCCLTSDLDVTKMALIDIEYFFLQLRAKSISEMIDLDFVCNNITEKGECGNKLEIKLDINTIEIANMDKSRKIEITSNIVAVMNYPKLIPVDKKIDDIEFLYDMAVDCLETVYEGENIYPAKDYKKEDLYFFFTHLNPLQFQKVEQFLTNGPVLRKQIDYKCSKCGFLHTIKMEGLQSFFG